MNPLSPEPDTSYLSTLKKYISIPKSGFLAVSVSHQQLHRITASVTHRVRSVYKMHHKPSWCIMVGLQLNISSPRATD